MKKPTIEELREMTDYELMAQIRKAQMRMEFKRGFTAGLFVGITIGFIAFCVVKALTLN